ncbi:sugar phosphate nucleotidyltransferase, partial [Alphaproteobacteria bacterium]|nr:sugar phosphate nucleotidyltransferase [Alphaproteobacteria bacterium]
MGAQFEMILIICMAGLNTRYHDVGFDIPKYLLPWGEKTIIHAILSELLIKYEFGEILLLPNRRDRYFKNRLLESLSDLPIGENNISYVADTKGQAHTAALGAQIATEKFRDVNKMIAFHNSDTIIQNRNINSVAEQLKRHDAYIDIFPASSPNYSYVSLESGMVTRIVENEIVSPFASSGFYAFRSIDSYLRAFNQTHEARSKNESDEMYLSDVLQEAIRTGSKVFV